MDENKSYTDSIISVFNEMQKIDYCGLKYYVWDENVAAKVSGIRDTYYGKLQYQDKEYIFAYDFQEKFVNNTFTLPITNIVTKLKLIRKIFIPIGFIFIAISLIFLSILFAKKDEGLSIQFLSLTIITMLAGLMMEVGIIYFERRASDIIYKILTQK